MITVIDYGAGNLRSVENTLKFLGVPHRVTASPRDVAEASSILLPGVGHFGQMVRSLEHLEMMPVLRDPDGCGYFKEDAGKLLVGFFEPKAKPWGMEGIPADSEFITLPDDWEHVAPELEKAAARVPLLSQAGIRTFFNGPESFTPDDRYLLGEADRKSTRLNSSHT